MPLNANMSHSDMVSELMKSYKDNGKIGNTTPRDTKHALEIANAIAYNKKGSAKIEALESYIKSLIRPENKTFIEGVVLKGLKVCLEAELEPPRRLMGRVIQYDSSVGKYYSPSTDTYLEYDEVDALERDDSNAQKAYASRIQKGLDNTKSAKEMNYLINAKHLYWNTPNARKAEAFAMKLSGDMEPHLANNIMNSLEESVLVEDDQAIPLIGSESDDPNKAPSPDELANINPAKLTQNETNALKVQMDETQKAKDTANTAISELSNAIKDATTSGNYDTVSNITDKVKAGISNFNEKANKLKASATETSVNEIS